MGSLHSLLWGDWAFLLFCEHIHPRLLAQWRLTGGERDILAIYRHVNQRAFLIIEVFVIALMPLSIWPIIISGISIIWPDLWTFFQAHCGNYSLQFICFLYPYHSPPGYQPGTIITSASVITATFATIGLNAAFIVYICIAVVKDTIHGHKFLPIYSGESSLSSPGTGINWYLFGTPRSSPDRAAMVNHCADYMLRNSVFRKHA